MSEKLGESKRCLLCLRIKFEDIYSLCAKLYNEETDRYQVAEKASSLIRDAYLKHPTMLCGHAPSALMSAAVYIAGVILEKRRTQMQIHKSGGSTPTTIRQNYNLLKEAGDFEV